MISYVINFSGPGKCFEKDCIQVCNDQVCSVDFNVLIIGWSCIVRSYHKCCDGSLLEVDTDRVRQTER